MARHVTAAALSIFVTFGLFYLMHTLIAMGEMTLDEKSRTLIDFVRLKKDSEAQQKERKLPDKEKPEEPPPPPELNLSKAARPDQVMQALTVAVDVSIDLSGPNLGAAASDSDVVPIVRVEPTYPIRAKDRGIEGWVVVSFTISKTGSVAEASVTANHPNSIFNKEALRAIKKWKYNPKIEDGEPVERSGIEVKLNFTLTNKR